VDPDTALLWLRRDLRLHDHPALHRLTGEFERVLCVFVLDDRLLAGRCASGPRTAFMLGCLRALDDELRERGSGLIVRRGRPEEELAALAGELGAGAVGWTSDVSPFARARDRRVTEALLAAGVAPVPCGGGYAIDVGRIATKDRRRPYTVFGPFWHAWRDVPRRPVHPAPARLAALPPGLASGALPSLAALGLAGLPAPFAEPGEAAARRALDAWLDGPVDRYAERHDAVGEPGTSGLSPYLRWGCLSVRECEERAVARGGEGAAAWIRQLCWRDFLAHVLLHHPDNVRREHQERFRQLAWEDDAPALEAWRAGRTGYPLVDAGMRQLAATGWMHNRARMVAGSFLTKDLHLDWRAGEEHFARLLLDGEPAQNNGNWQWVASVGVDPAPAARRIFNPTLQAQRFDPDGAYIRAWVPELRGVLNAAIHEPWTMSEAEQEAAGCAIGRDYPAPIVDHMIERRRALERYAGVRRSA